MAPVPYHSATLKLEELLPPCFYEAQLLGLLDQDHLFNQPPSCCLFLPPRTENSYNHSKSDPGPHRSDLRYWWLQILTLTLGALPFNMTQVN